MTLPWEGPLGAVRVELRPSWRTKSVSRCCPLKAWEISDLVTLVVGDIWDNLRDNLMGYYLKNILHNWDNDNDIMIYNDIS